jgi:hypothetical protein
MKVCVLALAALVLAGLFSKEVSDWDFWFHLASGQYTWRTHALTSPDPFAYATALAPPASAAEAQARQFNLTHEWLAQVLFYVIYRYGGFAALVALRALMMTAFCGLVGLISYWRCGGFYRSLGAALLAAWVVHGGFDSDRPYLFTFVLLAATVAILEWGKPRALWLLPAILLFWANCHGGFFLGWVAMGAWSAEALVLRWQGRPLAHERTLWMAGAAAVLASAANPNGLRVVPVLLFYRNSAMQNLLLEWGKPSLWPPRAFGILLFVAAAAMLWNWRKVRIADWLLFAAFGAAALSAERNTVLAGFVAPILIATYVPWKRWAVMARPLPRWVHAVAVVIAAAGLSAEIAQGASFQFHHAEWKYPAGAADFLLAHHVTGPLFNTYEYGGYLMWRLWPHERVFIDGRALSERVFQDYLRILYNNDETGGKSREQLLDQYGVQTIVMGEFEYTGGLLYRLAPALADPAQTEWKLVYGDAGAVVFMRHPPEGVAPLDSTQVIAFMEAACALHLEREPQYTRCARALAQMYNKVGESGRARQWLGVYLTRPHPPDEEAERAYADMVGK